MKKFLALAFLVFNFTIVNAQDKPEGLFINSKAPDFKGKDQNGKEISLKDLRKKGPVVVVFYRGNWCPYCNKELKRMQDSLQLLTDKSAQVVAISPEKGEGITKTVEKTGATFSILHDEDMKIAKGYGVAYQVDEKTQQRYKSFGNDLLEINGQKERAYLPVPAVYIVNRDGTITFRYFEEDYRKRVLVKDLLNNL
ncbi:peroxiredoxin-like family protein [Flavisolibacter tropicus]|uniref:peroxiredoxin-like family protein n=1 Tax=Flavisolibacter tropicus TaxID=1492898 RepID=UPI00082DDBFD|nr:peroxiredoxin-like family protein [Flavisolibacter tropicus]